jgi:hypothetical protein
MKKLEYESKHLGRQCNITMRWYGHFLKMNEAIPKKVLNKTVKGKWPRGRVRTR